jgi:hypothetical protein
LGRRIADEAGVAVQTIAMFRAVEDKCASGATDDEQDDRLEFHRDRLT